MFKYLKMLSSNVSRKFGFKLSHKNKILLNIDKSYSNSCYILNN